MSAEYSFVPSPHRSSRGSNIIKGVILHYTGGGDATGTVEWFMHPSSKSSAHYVISRSGVITQMVRLDEAAWHCGSRRTTPTLNGETGLNSKTIGIELCNWGPLYSPVIDEPVQLIIKDREVTRIRRSANYYTWYRNWTHKYEGLDPFKASMRNVLPSWPGGSVVTAWEPYSEAQISALITLLKELTASYPISREWISRHQDIDPTRKMDTGPALDIPYILDHVFDSREQASEVALVDSRYEDDELDRFALMEEMVEYHESRDEEVSVEEPAPEPWWRLW